MKASNQKIKEIEKKIKREEFIFSIIIFFVILISIIGYTMCFKN
jgi:hypothetical protein